MAQSGFTPIQLYFSTTASAVPTAGNLANGELAINITDGKVYYKDNAGVVQLLASQSDLTTISFGSTGLTPNTATGGAVTVSGTLVAANGGTGYASYTTGDLLYASGSTALSKLTIGSNGQIMQSNGTAPVWVNASSVVGGAAGSNTQIQFNNSGALGASSNLTWNGTTLAVTGALTATADSTFSSTGALTISKGDTAARPGSPVSGMLRFNTATSEFEGYNGTAWASVGGAALVNDTSTASNLFPLFATATTGTAATLNTSNAKLLYKPSTGEFQSSELVASNGIFVNSKTVTASYTVPSGSNAMSSGPVTVADGITVTVSDGSVWTVI
jgi:hypothetical protein